MSPAVQICDLISLICLNIKEKEKRKKNHLNLSRTLINTSLYFMYTSNALPLHLQYTSMELCRIKRKSKNC